MNPYNEQSKAAPNIKTLLKFLYSEDENRGNFVYRGQIRNWPGPLIPSIYRCSIQKTKRYTQDSPEYKYRLRGIGSEFIEMEPDSYIPWIIMDHGIGPLGLDEWEFLQQVANIPGISGHIALSGYDSFFTRIKHHIRGNLPDSRKELWKRVLDEKHRGMVREDGFLQPFGYMFGMTLAQQYGFASEMLDFTSDVNVAAFFATYGSPSYRSPINSCNSEGFPGVIFRLPRDGQNIGHHRIDSFNYYTAPGQIHLSDVCKRFEDKSSPELSMQSFVELDEWAKAAMSCGKIVFSPWMHKLSCIEKSFGIMSTEERFRQYYNLYFNFGWKRFYRLLDMPRGSYSTSRVGRQSSVMVVPDELRVQQVDSKGTITKVDFQAMEDLSTRAGFEAFYFKHSDVIPELGGVTREYLWPLKNDRYKELVLELISPESPPWAFLETIVPKRIDLLDLGYRD